MTRLRLHALRFLDYGPVEISISTGECVALSGPSGSGKTLLLRAIADLDEHAGLVFLDDVECASVPAPEWRRRVGLLPAESSWWRDTVGEHFAASDSSSMEKVGFKLDVLTWQIARLSTGERQRLALVRLLANQPQALLLDEPTANLDAENAARVESLIADYRQATRAAVLWVTHDPQQARRIAVRCYRLDGGCVTAENTR